MDEKRYEYIAKERRQVYITNTVEAIRQASDRLFRTAVLSFMLKRNPVTESPKYQVAQIAFSVQWDLVRRASSIQQCCEREKEKERERVNE